MDPMGFYCDFMDLFGDFGGILAMDLMLSDLFWGKSGWLPPTFRFTGGIFHRIFPIERQPP